jgi:hypothetical protein
LSGWAAKELTEKGSKSANARTRMNIEHIKDYDSAMKHLGNLNELENLPQTKKEHPVQTRDYPYNGNLRKMVG